MAKRRLSNRQHRRISAKVTRSDAEGQLEDAREGLVIVQHGRHVEIEDSETGAIVRCKQRANLPIVVAGDRILWRAELSGEQTDEEDTNKVQGKAFDTGTGTGTDAKEGPANTAQNELDRTCTRAETRRIENAKHAVVESLLPRSSLIQRPDKFGKLRTLAANVELMLITIAPKPEPFFNLIDRYIVAANYCGIEPHILINKIDLVGTLDQHEESVLKASSSIFSGPGSEELVDESIYSDIQERLAAIKSFYPSIGVPVIEVSSKHKSGVAALKNDIAEMTTIFVGQSGVGKSSLIQSLAPPDAHDIAVGKLSSARDKGRHTTSYSRLYKLVNSASCIDSPGIREFGLWHMRESDIIKAFPDVEEIAKACKFRDCQHGKEPACEIQKKISEDAFFKLRFDSYKAIVHSLNDVDIYQKKREK